MSEQERPPAPVLKPLGVLEDLEDLDAMVGAVCDPNDPDCEAPARLDVEPEHDREGAGERPPSRP